MNLEDYLDMLKEHAEREKKRTKSNQNQATE